MTLKMFYTFPGPSSLSGTYKKRHIVKCSTLKELIAEARVVFSVEEDVHMFLQRLDETWHEEIDIANSML